MSFWHLCHRVILMWGGRWSPSRLVDAPTLRFLRSGMHTNLKDQPSSSKFLFCICVPLSLHQAMWLNNASFCHDVGQYRVYKSLKMDTVGVSSTLATVVGNKYNYHNIVKFFMGPHKYAHGQRGFSYYSWSFWSSVMNLIVCLLRVGTSWEVLGWWV